MDAFHSDFFAFRIFASLSLVQKKRIGLCVREFRELHIQFNDALILF